MNWLPDLSLTDKAQFGRTNSLVNPIYYSIFLHPWDAFRNHYLILWTFMNNAEVSGVMGTGQGMSENTNYLPQPWTLFILHIHIHSFYQEHMAQAKTWDNFVDKCLLDLRSKVMIKLTCISQILQVKWSKRDKAARTVGDYTAVVQLKTPADVKLLQG